MSIGAGTLATKGSQYGVEEGSLQFNVTKKLTLAASGNGRQHCLPEESVHIYTKLDKTTSRYKWEDQSHFLSSFGFKQSKEEEKDDDSENRMRTSRPKLSQRDIEAHWDLKQAKGPTRLYGTIKATRYGGEARVDGQPDLWTNGEYWNVDSNIRKWGEHEVRRNMAAAAHDVHRHDQILRVVLPPKPGQLTRTGKPLPPRQTVSGVVTADMSFLEAYGFDLGTRDRQAKPVPGMWKPASTGQMFRSLRSFDRNVPRIAEAHKTMRRSKSSTLGATNTSEASKTEETVVRSTATLRPEDIGGEAGEMADADDLVMQCAGRSHASRSCPYWNAYDHTAKREAAKMSNATFSASLNSHSEAYPFKENLELSPASVYTLKYKRSGEGALREHKTSEARPAASRARPWLENTARGASYGFGNTNELSRSTGGSKS